MQNLEPQKLIESSVLFRHLQPHETATIIARLQPASYERGAHILERGIWHGQLYIIASGQVSVLLQDGAGNEDADVVVAHLGPGECFGEMSLITGEPPTATIRAEQDTILWSLPQADFLTLIGNCPTLPQNINAVLSQRLARTNQQILSHAAAERIWLHFVDNLRNPLERSLAFHIADALVARSTRRVLLLELCKEDEAVGPHFATYPEQVRPDLLACLSDSSMLQRHHTPILVSDGQRYPAVAVLMNAADEEPALDSSIEGVLVELARFYDYILLVTTEATPPALRQIASEQSQQSITIVSAEETSRFTTADDTSSIFVANVLELPTMGVQDNFASRLGHPVKRLLPADTPLLEQCWKQQVSFRQFAAEADLTKAVDFVARHIAHLTIGIAFGGGGARGFAHLGVLERLVHYNIPLDYIAGCSSGIITPGMYLIGKSFAESEEIFLEIQHHVGQWRIPRTSLFSNRGLKYMLQSLCGELRFEDLTTPFAMVAVDLSTRAGVVLDHGPIWQAGLASVALPGFFPPVLIGEHILMDAGMHDPVPIRLVRQMGADILLASELGGQEPPSLENATSWLETAKIQPPKRSPHLVDILLRTYDLAMATIGMHSIREADVVFRPRLHKVSLRQFSEGRKFVATGREAVEQSLPALKEHLPWL